MSSVPLLHNGPFSHPSKVCLFPSLHCHPAVTLSSLSIDLLVVIPSHLTFREVWGNEVEGTRKAHITNIEVLLTVEACQLAAHFRFKKREDFIVHMAPVVRVLNFCIRCAPTLMDGIDSILRMSQNDYPFPRWWSGEAEGSIAL